MHFHCNMEHVYEPKHIFSLLESQNHIWFSLRKFVHKEYNDFESWLARDLGNIYLAFIRAV